MDPTRAPGAQPPRSRRSGDDRGRGLRRDEPGRVASHHTHRGALALVPVGRVRRPARVFPLDGVLDGTPRRPSPARARVAVLAAARSHPRRRRARHPAVLRRRCGPHSRAAHGTPGRAQRQLLAARPSRPQDRSTRAAPDRLDSLRVQGREVGPPGIAQGDGSAVTRLPIALMIVLAVLASPIGASAQQPKSGGVFRIGIPDPPALDPHQVVNFLPQTVASLAYSHLLRFPAGPEQSSSTDFRILPDLAEKWEYQNPTTLVFSLRKGVRFHTKPPVNDVRVRRAVSLAIDRKAWNEALLFGEGCIDSGPVPCAMTEWKLDASKLDAAQRKYLVGYDPGEAKRLLADAGFPRGFSAPLFHWPGFPPPWRSYFELAADMLGRVGVGVELKPEELAKYSTTTGLGKFEKMAMGPYGAGVTEVDDFLYGMFFPEAPWNRSHVNDAELNKLLLAQRREMDPKKRREIVYEIQRHLADKVYYVDLPMYPRYISHPPYVKGFKHHDGYDLGRRLTFTWIDRAP